MPTVEVTGVRENQPGELVPFLFDEIKWPHKFHIQTIQLSIKKD